MSQSNFDCGFDIVRDMSGGVEENKKNSLRMISFVKLIIKGDL